VEVLPVSIVASSQWNRRPATLQQFRPLVNGIDNWQHSHIGNPSWSLQAERLHVARAEGIAPRPPICYHNRGSSAYVPEIFPF